MFPKKYYFQKYTVCKRDVQTLPDTGLDEPDLEHPILLELFIDFPDTSDLSVQ